MRFITAGLPRIAHITPRDGCATGNHRADGFSIIDDGMSMLADMPGALFPIAYSIGVRGCWLELPAEFIRRGWHGGKCVCDIADIYVQAETISPAMAVQQSSRGVILVMTAKQAVNNKHLLVTFVC